MERAGTWLPRTLEVAQARVFSQATQSPVNEHSEPWAARIPRAASFFVCPRSHHRADTLLGPLFQLCSFSEGARGLALTPWLLSPLSFLKPRLECHLDSQLQILLSLLALLKERCDRFSRCFCLPLAASVLGLLSLILDFFIKPF